MRKFISVLFLCLSLLTCPKMSCAANSAEESVTEKDEFAVYSVTLSKIFSKRVFDEKPIEILVIENQTRVDDFEGKSIFSKELFMTQDIPKLSQETVDDFQSENRQTYALTNPLSVPFKYELVSNEFASDIVRRHAWREFYKKYLNSPGVVSMSRVGFNRARDQALVYVAQAYGDDGGRGKLVLLKRKQSGWKVQSILVNWAWVG